MRHRMQMLNDHEAGSEMALPMAERTKKGDGSIFLRRKIDEQVSAFNKGCWRKSSVRFDMK